ncbi:MAG: 5-methyltetrahydropteroyltriglutamate--homocysteine S-methyltransferase [Burkholderiales bacterium]|nr:5-methyltetrahydropteroyltriglutamate--homocysteine S-methyltransferase [Burkholderiales bacterium]
MTVAHILGFSRIGARRQLKFALERYWRGEAGDAELVATGRELRRAHWALQRAAGLDYVTVGDFAWYDHVLQLIAHLGCLPARFGFRAGALTLREYFSLARGTDAQPAMEMTKWFDTNYHYLVPEWSADTRADGGVSWLIDEAREAIADGHPVKAALVGPLTLLHLGKARGAAVDLLALLEHLVPAYRRLLARLKDLGVEWVQLDEPVLGLDLEQRWVDAFRPVYTALAPAAPRILLATYFESVAARRELFLSLPISGLHLDLVRAPGQLETLIESIPGQCVLSLGVVDGRNVWRTDLDAALATLRRAQARAGERLWVSASCSLLHVPVDLGLERDLDLEIAGWLAFGAQKLEEISALKRALALGDAAIAPALAASRRARDTRRASTRTHSAFVASRLAALTGEHARRASAYPARSRRQRERLGLPLLPATTIGSFAQTGRIRHARAAFRRGAIGFLDYLEAMRAEIRFAIAKQEALGLDVLVHGEPERGDMVEYFAGQLAGFAVTTEGWVQSYGSRCVRPPVIYGDVHRPEPMTVEWARYAQSLTRHPVKGMLTGPVTMLQWSFARDDGSRETAAMQIALALREEVLDLEKAGIAIIQIDEPAFREGLPLRRRDRARYLEWAARAFRVAASGVGDATQIHSHMCYAEFNDILPAIAALDADVITIETSRSAMELIDAFGAFSYPNEIGPGIYDIHSPRVPDAGTMLSLIERAARVIPVERLWVNPDCGLKTRGWEETEVALANMVAAARRMRELARDTGAMGGGGPVHISQEERVRDAVAARDP